MILIPLHSLSIQRLNKKRCLPPEKSIPSHSASSGSADAGTVPLLPAGRDQMQKALNFPPLRVRLETSCPNPAQAKEPGVDALQQRKRRGGDLCPSWGSVPSLRVTARSSSLEVDVLSQFPWKQEEVGKEMGSECSLPAGRAAAGAGMRWLRVFAPKPGGG